MKYFITTLLIVTAFALTAFAQNEETLFDRGVRVTGFGGPGVYYTQFNGDPHVLVGGHGGILLNSTVYAGLAAYGLASGPDAGIQPMEGGLYDTEYEAGFGGLMLGMVVHSDQLLHAMVDVTVGGGSVNIMRDDWERHNDDFETHSSTDDFFMVQPMAHAEVNVFPWMRVNAGAGYRFVNGVTEFGLDDSDVSGPVAGLGFRFGKF